MKLTQISTTPAAAPEEPKAGKRYWRSLDQLAGKPSFREWLHREFPENATEMLRPASRRTLLQLMAASIGLAGLTACRRPEEKILPASKGVEDYIPGNRLVLRHCDDTRRHRNWRNGGIARRPADEGGRESEAPIQPGRGVRPGRRLRCSIYMTRTVPGGCSKKERTRTGRASRPSPGPISRRGVFVTAAASGS